MTFLRGYIISLCSLMVVFSAIFTVIPSGDTKKTLRTVIGIVTALVLISPFFGQSEGLLAFEFPESDELVDYKRAEQMEKRTLRQVEIGLEEQIKAVIGRECEVRAVVSAEGIIEKVEIENVTENEKTLVSEKLGIDKNRIEEP